MVKEGNKRISITLTKEGFDDLIEMLEENDEVWKKSKSNFINALITWYYNFFEERNKTNDRKA